MKTCPSCGSMGDIDEQFGRRRPGGPANSYCRACAAARTRAWYLVNRGRPRPPVDREKARARQRKYVAEHRELVNARNAERDRRNPEAKRERVRRRRARIKGTSVEPVDYRMILARHGRLCHLCGLPIDGAIDFDHVVPIAMGGAHSADNIRPSHPPCNRSKGARIAARDALEREAA